MREDGDVATILDVRSEEEVRQARTLFEEYAAR